MSAPPAALAVAPHPPRRPAAGHVRRLALPRGGRRRGPGGVRAQQPAGRAGPADHRAGRRRPGLVRRHRGQQGGAPGTGGGPGRHPRRRHARRRGTLRDVLVDRSRRYCGAAITVTAVCAGSYGLPAAAGAVLACFLIAVLGALRLGPFLAKNSISPGVSRWKTSTLLIAPSVTS